MKIHIIGGPGSGKTHIANLISEKLKIKSYDLDTVNWDNKPKVYGIKNPPEKRDALLKEIVNKPDWIIEGVYFEWTDPSFEKADKIIFIKSNLITQIYRIILRFIKRKIRIIKAIKKETFKNIYGLIRWTIYYNKKEYPRIMKKLHKYNDKLFIVNKNIEVLNILNLENRKK